MVEITDEARRLHVREAVEAGLADSEAGRTTPVDEVRKRFGLEPESGSPPDPSPTR